MKLIIDNSKKNTKLPKVMRAAIRWFVQKGIEGTTIKDIARHAGVAEGALYRHFKSKEDLAWHLFSTHLNQFSIELMGKVLSRKECRARVEVFISECLSAFEKERDLFTYLILSEHRELKKFSSHHMHPGHVVLKIIEDGQKEGLIRAADPQVLSALFLGAVIRVCVVRMYGSIPKDLRKHAPDITRSLWALLSKD